MSELIVIGCGSRRTAEVVHLRHKARELVVEAEPTYLIEGGATGGDRIWKDVAQRQGVQVIECPVSSAQWRQVGRSAGHVRNGLMATLAAQLARLFDLAVECWALPGGRGTAGMKRIARGHGWRVVEVS